MASGPRSASGSGPSSPWPFWLAVILTAPDSLSQVLALQAGSTRPRGMLPLVEASAASFFEKCKTFSSGFFMALYTRFVDLVAPQAPKAYCREMAHLLERFTDVVVVDGSRLDKIAHRLKILWQEKAAILPGCILAVYDLFRGFAVQLWFDADAAARSLRGHAWRCRAFVRNADARGPALLLSGDVPPARGEPLLRPLPANEAAGIRRSASWRNLPWRAEPSSRI